MVSALVGALSVLLLAGCLSQSPGLEMSRVLTLVIDPAVIEADDSPTRLTVSLQAPDGFDLARAAQVPGGRVDAFVDGAWSPIYQVVGEAALGRDIDEVDEIPSEGFLAANGDDFPEIGSGIEGPAEVFYRLPGLVPGRYRLIKQVFEVGTVIDEITLASGEFTVR